MKRSLVLAAVLLSGCAGSTHTVAPEAFDDARSDLSGRTVTLVLTDGTLYQAGSLRLEADTTTWINLDTGELLAIPTWAIAEVQQRDRGRSALRTAGAGALVAGALGFTAGMFICADWGCNENGYLLMGAMGLATAPGGALYGGVAGAIANRPDTWSFVLQEPEGTLVLSPANAVQRRGVASSAWTARASASWERPAGPAVGLASRISPQPPRPVRD